MDDDGASTSPGSATPAGKAATGEPPGLRTQFGATFDAVKRLLGAHIDLAKAELGDIVDAVKRMVALDTPERLRDECPNPWVRSFMTRQPPRHEGGSQ